MYSKDDFKKETQVMRQTKSLMRAIEDPNVTTVTQAYDWVIQDLKLTKEQRPGLRRAKAVLLKQMHHALEVLS